MRRIPTITGSSVFVEADVGAGVVTLTVDGSTVSLAPQQASQLHTALGQALLAVAPVLPVGDVEPE